MKNFAVWVGLFVTLSGVCLAKKKPNLIYIMADDMGWHDIGFHNPKINSPNIDWLKYNGIELTNYYTGALCSPSRTAMLTGKYPSNNGGQQWVWMENSKACIPVELKLWPQYMKDQGYATKYVGKWHAGYCSDQCLPTNRGIDDYRGIIGSEAGFYDWTESDTLMRWENGNSSLKDIGTHLTHKDEDDVVEMINSHANKSDDPLFMIISPNAPHTPFDVTPEMYQSHDFLDDENQNHSNRRKFLGLVNALDIMVGKILKVLLENDMLENSIIVFTSDNGGSSYPLPHPGLLSFGNNYPFRNGKSSLYEGGTHVPAVYYNPMLPESTRNTKRDFLMHVTDWLPTFAELAGAAGAEDGIDGISQVSNLGPTYLPWQKYQKRKEMLYGLSDLVFSGSMCSDEDAAFRWKDWKLIYGQRAAVANLDISEWTKPVESPELPDIEGDSCLRDDGNGNMVARCLFNVNDDPSETKNWYDEKPNLVRDILRKINLAKEESVKNVFSPSLGTTPETVERVFGMNIPKHNYCDPATDFPLRPRPAACRARVEAGLLFNSSLER